MRRGSPWASSRSNTSDPCLAEAIELISEELPRTLIDERARYSLTRMARRLPIAWATFGFEVRLGEDRSVDLGVSAVSGPLGIFAEKESFGSGRAWNRLRDFDARWTDARTRLYRWVPFVFLEVDAPEAKEAEPTPSIFVALDAPLRDLAAHSHMEAACEVAALLLDLPHDSLVAARLKDCFAALPRSGTVLHVGAMLGRPEQTLRVSVALAGAEVAGYLRTLGAVGAAEAAARAVAKFSKWLVRAQIDFDLAPGVQPRIGFGVRPRHASQWPPLLADIGDAGLAEPEKLLGLLTWTGPSALQAGPASAPIRFERTLSHVKLVSEPNGVTAAKAYFGVQPAPPSQ